MFCFYCDKSRYKYIACHSHFNKPHQILCSFIQKCIIISQNNQNFLKTHLCQKFTHNYNMFIYLVLIRSDRKKIALFRFITYKHIQKPLSPHRNWLKRRCKNIINLSSLCVSAIRHILGKKRSCSAHICHTLTSINS